MIYVVNTLNDNINSFKKEANTKKKIGNENLNNQTQQYLRDTHVF